jgi:hypothetical protein
LEQVRNLSVGEPCEAQVERLLALWRCLQLLEQQQGEELFGTIV